MSLTCLIDEKLKSHQQRFKDFGVDNLVLSLLCHWRTYKYIET